MRSPFLVALAVLCLTGCSGDELFDLAVGAVELQVEVVDTEETRAQGLMFRESMPLTHGMLFAFDAAEPRAFYMKNTSIPLSIAYIDARLIIREIHDMEPFSLETIWSSSPAQYALEMNQGSFDRLGMAVGDRLTLSDELADRLGR